jgi:hypothetical protein
LPNGDESNDVVEGMKENKINRHFEGARHGAIFVALLTILTT